MIQYICKDKLLHSVTDTNIYTKEYTVAFLSQYKASPLPIVFYTPQAVSNNIGRSNGEAGAYLNNNNYRLQLWLLNDPDNNLCIYEAGRKFYFLIIGYTP